MKWCDSKVWSTVFEILKINVYGCYRSFVYVYRRLWCEVLRAEKPSSEISQASSLLLRGVAVRCKAYHEVECNIAEELSVAERNIQTLLRQSRGCGHFTYNSQLKKGS